MGILEEELLLQPEKKEEDIIKIENKKKSSLSIDSILQEEYAPRDIWNFFQRQKTEKIPSVINNQINLFTNDIESLVSNIKQQKDIIPNQISVLRRTNTKTGKISLAEELLAGEINVNNYEEILSFSTHNELLEKMRIAAVFLNETIGNKDDLEYTLVNNFYNDMSSFSSLIDSIVYIHDTFILGWLYPSFYI